MIIQRDFLVKALPDAQIFVGNRDVTHEVEWQCGILGQQCGAAIDSRLVVPGDIFFALDGAATDGHLFIEQALEKGASGLVIKKSKRGMANAGSKLNAVSIDFERKHADKLIVLVDDPYEALLALTRAWRAQLTCPVVGITGSIGKTTTKEMVRSMLAAAKIPSFVSYKNYNTIIGVCLNLLRAESLCKAVVLEVGISHKGEMEEIARLLRPTIGLITCIAHSHGEGLGGLVGITDEKRKLFAGFDAHNVGIIFGDQGVLSSIRSAHPITKFGFKPKNQVCAKKVNVLREVSGQCTTHFELRWFGQCAQVKLNGNHPGLVHNALAASSIAYFLHIPLATIVEALATFQGFENRFQLRKLKGGNGELLSDCYNANPESMRAALMAFDQMPSAKKKIVVIGDMLELGPREMFWHRQVGRVLHKTTSIKAVILVGLRAQVIAKTAPTIIAIETAADWQEACEKLKPMVAATESFVLVKASGGMKLDRLVAEIAEPA